MIRGKDGSCLNCRGSGWRRRINGSEPELCSSCAGSGGHAIPAVTQVQAATLHARVQRLEGMVGILLRAAGMVPDSEADAPDLSVVD